MLFKANNSGQIDEPNLKVKLTIDDYLRIPDLFDPPVKTVPGSELESTDPTVG